MAVEVGIRELRSNLSSWLERAAAGEDVIVTERGKPKARLSAVTGKSTFDRMIEEGRITPPRSPRSPVDFSRLPRLRGEGPTMSDYVIENR